jgi:hypothetical protein
MAVVGWGREGCNGCFLKRKAVLERGGQCIDLRSSGAIQTFGPGNKLTVKRTQKAGFDAEIKKLSPEFC